MKEQRHQGGPAALNVYVVGSINGFLGYATFPDEYRYRPGQDGVVIVNGAFPGGNQGGLNTGKILVHEVGRKYRFSSLIE